MKNNKSVIVGIFILLGLAILVVTIFTLGGQKKTFVKTFTIYAVFNDVSGLLKGGNIWFSGVKVGSVKKISFYGKSQVLVTMSIENDVDSYIRKNAHAKIGSDGLIGNKIIIIYGGDSTLPQVVENDYLTVEDATTTDDMLATLQNNNKNLLEITNTFKSISKKIDSGSGTLATLLNDPAMSNKLNSSVDNLQATVANFKVVSASSKNVLASLNDFTANLNKQGNSVNELVTDTAIFKNIKATMVKLEQATNEVNEFTINLKKTSERLNEKDNVAGILLNDPASAASVKITLQNLQSASLKLDEDLEALQHNFLFRKYFKKKDKANKENKPDTIIIQ